MPVVTISAAYGAGGSAIGPAVAEQLGVPFLDRAIPVAVAERLDVSERDACDRDESIGPWLSRALLAFGQMGPVLGAAGTETPPVAGPDEFCAATEQVLRERAASGGAVILGRAGALVLADHPSALHVRLHGPARRAHRAGDGAGGDRPRPRPSASRSRPTASASATSSTSTAPTRATRRTTTWCSTPPRMPLRGLHRAHRRGRRAGAQG